MHIIHNVEALWPRIDKPYKWNDEQGGTRPANANDPEAHYELNIILDNDQLKGLIKAMKAAWDAGVAAKRITAKTKDIRTLAKIEAQEDGRYKVFCKIKNYDPTCKPKQTDKYGKPQDEDFQLTTGSLIQTPRGTMELKAFFSVGIQQEGQTETTSATSIKFKIKKLIEQEDPNAPISDDLIVSTLASDGIAVARRTVAKYRKLENIPSSFARKRRNVLSGALA